MYSTLFTSIECLSYGTAIRQPHPLFLFFPFFSAGTGNRLIRPRTMVQSWLLGEKEQEKGEGPARRGGRLHPEPLHSARRPGQTGGGRRGGDLGRLRWRGQPRAELPGGGREGTGWRPEPGDRPNIRGGGRAGRHPRRGADGYRSTRVGRRQHHTRLRRP